MACRQAAALLSTRKSGGSAASRAGDIVDQVRAEMKQCKISQTKLGQQTLISQAVVSQWLNRCYGGHNVKVDAAMKQWIEARRKGTVVEFDPDMPASILRPARAACTVAEKQARPPPWARGKQAGGTPPGPAPASSAGSKGAAGGAGPPLLLEEGPVGAGGAAALLSALANGALGGGPVGPFA